jgi:hypothetical protein
MSGRAVESLRNFDITAAGGRKLSNRMMQVATAIQDAAASGLKGLGKRTLKTGDIYGTLIRVTDNPAADVHDSWRIGLGIQDASGRRLGLESDEEIQDALSVDIVKELIEDIQEETLGPANCRVVNVVASPDGMTIDMEIEVLKG